MPAAPLRPVGGPAQLHFHSKRWCGTHGGRASRHERWFRAPARCRSETGAPFRAPAGMGCGAEFTLVGGSVMSAGFALPRDAGRRPALLSRAIRDGMWCGIHVGRASRHEGWFRASARCRSETGAPFRAPAGMGRGGECTLVGRRVMSAGFALPRDAGRRPALRSFSFGSTRFRGPVGRGAGLKAPTGRTGGVPFHPRPVSGRAQVRSGSVMTSTRAGPLVASAVLKASVSCSARSTRMPRPPQRVA